MRINKFLYFGDYLAVPVALAVLVYCAYIRAGWAAAPEFVSALLVGVFVWTLAEYWIHRVLYHHAPVLAEYHHRHHQTPRELIGIPSFLSSGIVILVCYAPLFAFAPIAADGFTAGGLIGYAAYMTVHHATHHWDIQPGRLAIPSAIAAYGASLPRRRKLRHRDWFLGSRFRDYRGTARPLCRRLRFSEICPGG